MANLTYTNKSNAKRAAVKAASKHFALYEVEVKAEPELYFAVSGNTAKGFTFELIILESLTVETSVPVVIRKIARNRPNQNGVTRPTSGGKCAIIWDTCDTLTAKLKQPVPFSELSPVLLEQGFNIHTVKTQYARWRTFNNVTGRVTLSNV